VMTGRSHRTQGTIPRSRQHMFHSGGYGARCTNRGVPGCRNHRRVRIQATTPGFAKRLHRGHIFRVVYPIQQLTCHRLCLRTNQVCICAASGHALTNGYETLRTLRMRSPVLMTIKRRRIQPADGFQGVYSGFMAYIATR
jgi:hypothetical protein